jgi:hypothetical protein
MSKNIGRELTSTLSLQEQKDIRSKHPSLGGVEFGKKKMTRQKQGEKAKTLVLGENRAGAGASVGLHKVYEMERDLKQEIAADTESLKEMSRHIGALTVDKGKIEAKIAEMETFVGAMSDEKSLGGVMKLFDIESKKMEKAYGNARKGHKDCIDLLKKEFGYHPAYRKGREGEFTGTYFTPDPDPTNFT